MKTLAAFLICTALMHLTASFVDFFTDGFESVALTESGNKVGSWGMLNSSAPDIVFYLCQRSLPCDAMAGSNNEISIKKRVVVGGNNHAACINDGLMSVTSLTTLPLV